MHRDGRWVAFDPDEKGEIWCACIVECECCGVRDIVRETDRSIESTARTLHAALVAAIWAIVAMIVFILFLR